MKRLKSSMWGCIILIIVLSVIGIKGRTGYYDSIKWDGDFISSGTADNMYVGIFPGNAVESVLNNIFDTINSQKYIFKVKIESEPIFSSFNYGYEAKIVKIYRGQDVNPKDSIFITSGSFIPFLNSGSTSEEVMNINSINCGFHNFLKKDREYIVILKDRLDCVTRENVFLFEGFSLLPIFDCSDTDSYPLYSDFKDSYFCKYSVAKKSEFFLTDEKAIKACYDFKKKLLSVLGEEK